MPQQLPSQPTHHLSHGALQQLTSRIFCSDATLPRFRGLESPLPLFGMVRLVLLGTGPPAMPTSETFLACCVRLSAANSMSLSAWLVFGGPVLASGDGW